MLTPPILTALTFRELVTTLGLWICLSVVADSVSGESSLPGSESCLLPVWEGLGALWGLLYKALIQFMEAPPS